MTRDNITDLNGEVKGIKSLYFRWLLEKLNPKKVKEYSSLLMELFEETFTENPLAPMDVNRARDGVALRKHYINSCPFLGDGSLEALKYDECSWLEMFLGLAGRIDDQLMFDMNVGNRTDEWFWLIIEQTGLIDMYGRQFNRQKVHNILDKLGRREYDNDGKNGVFRCKRDVRNVEIWYQMMEFFNENSPKIEF